MSEGIEPKGALRECFDFYPEFLYDFEVLVREGYLKVTSLETCKWLKSKTSLAEYFKWANSNAAWVPGGFWAPVENAFGIKRHSLRKLAGRNGNEYKPDESRDFMKIKPLLQQLRIQEQKIKYERRAFIYIKHLILCEAKLEKINEIFNQNVDKNKQNRR